MFAQLLTSARRMSVARQTEARSTCITLLSRGSFAALPSIVPLVLVALSPLAAHCADPTPGELRRRADVLIKQLASERYIERRAAQNELAEIGLVAFDQLNRARKHHDPEVAAAAGRLLSGITVRWIRPHDPPEVRDKLDQYARLDEERRLAVLRELRRLPSYSGIDALARIARYDASERVSARAAIDAMNLAAKDTSRSANTPASPQPPEEGRAALREVLAEQAGLYGPSERLGIAWLRVFTDQHLDPRAAADQWQAQLSELRDRSTRGVTDLDEETTAGLTWNLLRAQLLSGQQDSAAESAARLVTGDTRRATAVLDTILQWMLSTNANNSIDRLLALPSDLGPLGTKDGLYLAARARAKQGRNGLAEQLSQQALLLRAEPGLQAGFNGRTSVRGRLEAARSLELKGFPEWAHREYLKQIEESGVLSAEGVVAARLMAESLQDLSRYADAAEVLRTVLASASESPSNTKHYRDAIEELVTLNELTTLEAYNRAMACHASGDKAAERAALLEAVEKDPENADVLIAMYRASSPGEPYHEDTLRRIRGIAETFERKIDERPEEFRYYNYYGWLIANTEGDFDKAVRYSEQSLVLKPDTPEFLDTLARCYYAAGDLRKAVETQRKAIHGLPHLRVMRRQLALFEKELAKRETDPAE